MKDTEATINNSLSVGDDGTFNGYRIIIDSGNINELYIIIKSLKVMGITLTDHR